MDRVRFITHKGKQVLLLDYRDLTNDDEIAVLVADRRALVSEQPKNSLLTVADLTGAKFSKDTLTKIKEANVYDVPYVRRSALVGVAENQLAVVRAVETFAHRSHQLFSTLEEALDWIVSAE